MDRRRIYYLYFSAIALFFTVGIGVTGFMVIEGYTFTEAFYMTMITVSTVGFEEVRQLSQQGMIFTSFLIIISFGVFAYFITSTTKFMMDGEFRQYLKRRKMEKDLKNLKGHVIVCGFGRNGKQAAIELLLHNEKIVVIEKEQNVVDIDPSNEIWKNPSFNFVNGDAVQEDFLIKAKIEDAKALITTLPNDADNLFIVLTAREMNKNLIIISRASEDHSDIKLKRAGATNVIMPDKVGGARMAKLVAQPDVVEFIDSILIDNEFDASMVEINCDLLTRESLNKTLTELSIRRTTGVNLIGIKKKANVFIYNPPADYRLNYDDKLFVIGTPDQVKHLRKLLTGF
ncbi:MAG: potassium channel protein [Chloroflexia bacterium]|nr:potassium channel protein [Chloroflexia bacterium]